MENLRYKVLLVEDNDIERRAFERFVQNNEIPYDYVAAKSVSEAQQQLSCKKFDIVISDHDLGDGTAIEVLNFVNNTPVIVVTGAGDEETAINAWKAGAYDYLIKDLDQNYLKAIPITVENAVKHHIVEEKLQLLSGAIRSTEDSVYITNMQGEIIFVNKAFCKTYGYKEQEVIGKNSSCLWIGKNQSENTRSVFKTRSIGGGWEVGFYHKRKDDSIFPVSLSRSTIKDSNKRDVAIVGVARDISERILVEDELRTTSLKLQKRIQTQNEITILAMEAAQRLTAEGQIDKANKVISDYLDISRINAGALELNHTNFNFTTLVYQVTETLSSFAQAKNIELTCTTADSKIFINADFDRIAQILINLFLRAIEVTEPQNIVNVIVKDSSTELTVEIHDNSSSVDFINVHKIVNNTEWIKEQFNNGREDTALGLRIAKELIEIHGGRIWHQTDELRKENVVTFTIPKNSRHKKEYQEMTSQASNLI